MCDVRIRPQSTLSSALESGAMKRQGLASVCPMASAGIKPRAKSASLGTDAIS